MAQRPAERPAIGPAPCRPWCDAHESARDSDARYCHVWSAVAVSSGGIDRSGQVVPDLDLVAVQISGKEIRLARTEFSLTDDRAAGKHLLIEHEGPRRVADRKCHVRQPMRPDHGVSLYSE